MIHGKEGKSGIFIAGTGTEVGKTVVSAALVSWLQTRSITATYLKPVSTDGKMVDGQLVSPDAIWVKDTCGLHVSVHDLNPICFFYPLSPLASARMEKRTVSRKEIIEGTKGALKAGSTSVCEGVGGIMVPLSDAYTSLDFMMELALPVLLVAKPELGTINHTLLSLQAMTERGLNVLGFVFSGIQTGPASQVPSAKNSRLIEEFSGYSFLGELPFLESMDSSSLARAVSEHLDVQAIVTV